MLTVINYSCSDIYYYSFFLLIYGRKLLLFYKEHFFNVSCIMHELHYIEMSKWNKLEKASGYDQLI